MTEELWYGIAKYAGEYPNFPSQKKSNPIPWGSLQVWMNRHSKEEACTSIEIFKAPKVKS